MEDVFTVEEVAEHLKVSTKTVYRMLEDGRLGGIKLGREWRVRERDLKALLRRGGRRQK